MIPQVLEIASRGYFLHKALGFLEIKSGGEIKAKVDLDQFQTLLISSPSVTLSTPLIAELAKRNTAVILCDSKYIPCSIFQPVNNHLESGSRLLDQLSMTEPMKKNYWKQIVSLKLSHQALVLKSFGKKDWIRLDKLSQEVKSGDPDNKEAQGARVYWQSLMGENFRRRQNGEGKNILLNYGYTVLRSATIRGIFSAGLNPSLGFQHSNNHNPFCLADDLMEPYRPIIDALVYKIEDSEMDKKNKAIISKSLLIDVLLRNEKICLGKSFQNMSWLLIQGMIGKCKNIDLAAMNKDVKLWTEEIITSVGTN